MPITFLHLKNSSNRNMQADNV